MSTADVAKDIAKVDRLLLKLEHNLESARLSLEQQEALLSEVKVHGRNPKTLGPIVAERGIAVLSRYGLDQSEPRTSREAMRCLANAFLLNEPSRRIFVDLGYIPKAAERLKLQNYDDEFLISRILFLMTYNTTVDFRMLMDRHQLAESVNHLIGQHAVEVCKSNRDDLVNSSSRDMAMVETLKLLFNITHHHSDLVDNFTSSVEPLINLLTHCPLPTPPLQPPITLILNALMNLNLHGLISPTTGQSDDNPEPTNPSPDLHALVDRLVSILDEVVRSHSDKTLEEIAMPTFVLIRRIHEVASSSLKSHMRTLLLPNDADRDKPLGRGESLASRLLRLSGSSSAPNLRDNVSALLFELSDKDAAKFIHNIGYGLASGFLMSHNIEVPPEAMGSRVVLGWNGRESGTAINPITGQKTSAEQRDAPAMEEMTEEEKEREAERLFVLFERLKATGVVDVKNPVQQAIDEGRFEELD